MLYSILLVINYVSGVLMHDFHVSVCEIQFDEKSRALEVTHRIFLDDLEETLKNWSGDRKIDVLAPSDSLKFQEMLGKYIMGNFSISTNGKKSGLRYLGSEIEDDVMYCYIEVTGVKKLKSLGVENTILMEQFDDQVNLVHILRKGEKTKSLKLDSKRSAGTVSYD